MQSKAIRIPGALVPVVEKMVTDFRSQRRQMEKQRRQMEAIAAQEIATQAAEDLKKIQVDLIVELLAS